MGGGLPETAVRHSFFDHAVYYWFTAKKGKKRHNKTLLEAGMIVFNNFSMHFYNYYC